MIENLKEEYFNLVQQVGIPRSWNTRIENNRFFITENRAGYNGKLSFVEQLKQCRGFLMRINELNFKEGGE